MSPSTFQCTITIPDVKSYSTSNNKKIEDLHLGILCCAMVENDNPNEDKEKCTGDNKINFMKMLPAFMQWGLLS